jgi:beta-lactamase regulating signal transducer with metallopeptidase domain/thiol-disulfide isomerase/thioredoxin
MTSFSYLLLPSGFLVHCLNAALAPVVACAVAVVLSRRSTWSLPVRHALLVTALVASIAAPIASPLFRLPTIWAIRVTSNPERPLPAVDLQPKALIHSPQAVEPPVANAISIPVAETNNDRPEFAEAAVIPPVSVVADPSPPAPIQKLQFPTMTEWARIIGTLLCGLWFVGIAVGSVKAIFGLATLRRWMQTVSVAENPILSAVVRQAADGVGLQSDFVVSGSDLLPAPVTFGLFRPRIVVPAGIEATLPSDQLRAVLQHEMAHIARRDLWIGLLQQLAQIGYWWNPLVRLANRQLADLREQICDDIAIRELAEPGAYAATLIAIAERCSQCAPVPATLGIGSSPAGQLETRIRRIVSPRQASCIRLSRRAAAGVSAAAVLMAATMLFAQVQIESSAEQRSGEIAKTVQGEQSDGAVEKAPAKQLGIAKEKAPAASSVKVGEPQNPTLHDLIQRMAAYERMYFPYDIQAMETFRFPDDLPPEERARNLRADGRKHQRLMEYAQLERRIWRSKETDLVDDEVEQGPYERFSDGERIIQVSPSSLTINGVAAVEYYVSHRQNDIPNYPLATPLYGVFCLSAYSASELFSEVFKADKEAVELAWDNGDAKLTFGYGQPHWNMKFVLWLSRAHAWHPVRLQKFWDAKDKVFHDEWEVTKFVQHGKDWRIAEGMHRYHNRNRKNNVQDPRIEYSMDFRILKEKYGRQVDERQFKFEIPAGAKVRDDQKPEAEPPPPAKTREITVTVIDVAGKPIPNTTVRLPRGGFKDFDLVTTDEKGIARSSKAPADNVTVEITAASFRPVTWIVGDGTNDLRAIMTPVSTGVVVDNGQPVADAWITNRSLQIRADGYAYVPSRDWDGRDDDWSDSAGRFELKTNLTLRQRDAVIPLVAVHPNRDKMAIRFVPAGELQQNQEVALQSVCHVQGHCLLEGMTESVEVGIGLESSAGQYIGFLSTRRELTPEGLRVDFQLRFPPGDYVLNSRQTSHHSGFTIPFTIPKDRADQDLGTKSVPATGLVALKGKPAPELDVQWRPGQETNWQKLHGKVVVLDFWGMWCGPCVAGMPMLMEIADQFRDKPVAWLSIHTANFKDFNEFDVELAKCEQRDWDKRKLSFTTVLDQSLPEGEYTGKTSQRYGIAEWPTLIVIDQQGKIVGPIHKKKLAETIARLLDSGTEE